MKPVHLTLAILMNSLLFAHAGALTVDALKCERQISPIGIDEPRPTLSWTLKSDRRSDIQTAYQIIAATSQGLLAIGEPDLWDSGKVASSDTLGIPYNGKALASGIRVWWQVRVWNRDDKPSDFCLPQWWEMAIMQGEDWQAKWISDGSIQPEKEEEHYLEDPAPLFRKSFHTKGPVKLARLHASGLGYHELRLNGAKVGDQVLEPAWTCYDKRVPYTTHDITAMLHEGDNAVGVMLGNGWFNPLPLRFWGHRKFGESLAVGRPRLIARIDITYEDGSTQQIVTDETWKTTAGPILRNNIFLGEVYDARKEIPEWDTPAFDDSSWKSVTIEQHTLGDLHTQPDPPIRITEEIPAKLVSDDDAAPFIYDFGQNFTGVPRFIFNAPAGTTYHIRYGELLHPDGTLNPMTSVAGQIKGLRNDDSGHSVGGPGAPEIAWQQDTYIAKGGGPETYQPRFTFHGFRYLEITAKPVYLIGLRLHSDIEKTGSFSCSNDLFNRIQEMCHRTFVSNLIGVQSDCPHRERLAYGGDIVATSDAFLMNYDMHGFYRKTVRDWADSARPDGMLTDTAPFVGIQYCGVGWAMAHPLLVAQLHRYHGDRRLMEEQYQVARRWLLLVEKENPQHIVLKGLGDHESLVPNPTPPLVTAVYFQNANMLAAMAKTLGHTDDEKHFNTLAENIKKAWQSEFLDSETGIAGNGSQTNQSFALISGLISEKLRPLAIKHLLDDIRENHNNHLSTGIYGTKFMLELLSSEGEAATAYTIANQTTKPSWGWMLANDATTLWEHWAGSDGTFSHNHPMFGSISEWFFQWIAGIRPTHDAIGFDKIIIAPQPVGDLTWAKADYQSARGLVSSSWKKTEASFDLDLTIPVGSTATLFIPATDPDKVLENKQPTTEAKDITFLRMENNTAVYTIESGTYRFSSQ